MADNITLQSTAATPASGTVFATDDIGGVHYPIGKIAFGALNSLTLISATDGLPVAQQGTWTVIPGNTANTTAWLVTGTGGTFPVTDSGGSLTIDNAALSVTGGGVESSALRVTIASDSTGVLSVDDNGGSLTVDGSVSATQSGTWNIGTVTTVTTVSTVSTVTSVSDAQVQGKAAHDAVVSGNPVLTAGYASASAPTGVSGDGDVCYFWVDRSGRLQIGDGGSTISVDDGAGSLTIDNAALSVTGGGVESSALRVTIASDSTGVLSIDDNGGSITVDGTVAVSGTVTIAGAVTNAGTFAVQVDGAALTSLQLLDDAIYAEDVASQAGDKGISVLAVRRDANTSMVGTDGDYANLQVDSSGSLKVAIISGAGSGGTAMADDAAFTAATTSFTPVGGIVTADSVDAGDGGAFAMLANRQQKVTLYDSSGVELAVGGGTQYTEDAAAAANPVGNALIVVRDDARGGSLTTTDGDNVALRGNNSGELYVKHTDTIAATQSGTWNIGTVTTVTAVTAISNALPAGTNAIGKLAANSGVDIGDVDVTSVVAGTGATSLGKAEDAAHSSGDTGVFVLAVRSDTAASTAGTDGDYTALITDSTGKLHVNVGNTVTVASHAVTNAGTFAVQAACTNTGTFAVQVDGSALTSLQLLDDVVFADDVAFTPATSKVAAVGFLADETATDSVDEGDVGIARMTLDRKIHMVNECEADYVRIGGTAYQVKRAAVAAASSGENTLVSAVASRKIRVVALALIATTAVNMYLNNATDGAIFGGSTNKVALAATGGFVLPVNIYGWCQTGTVNEALRMNLSGAVAVAGSISYIEVP